MKAKNLTEGMYLHDLDNGYVVDVEEDPVVSFQTGRYSTDVGLGMVLVTFHDAEGDENYLLLQKNYRVKAGTDWKP